MLRINDYIISLDLIDKKFKCDLARCNGNCCRYGDSGAPLTADETSILYNIWPAVRPFLRDKGIKAVEELGTSVIDFEGDAVTPLIGKEECAYTILDDNIFMCGIEKAWSEGKINFRKPLTCHLFPVRIKQFSDFKTVNYEEWSICSQARETGKTKNIYVYEFLKEPLIRALGINVYNELCIAAEELRKSGLLTQS
jgi:hypothetical protein